MTSTPAQLQKTKYLTTSIYLFKSQTGLLRKNMSECFSTAKIQTKNIYMSEVVHLYNARMLCLLEAKNFEQY
jgi:hypothetical protein